MADFGTTISIFQGSSPFRGQECFWFCLHFIHSFTSPKWPPHTEGSLLETTVTALPVPMKQRTPKWEGVASFSLVVCSAPTSHLYSFISPPHPLSLPAEVSLPTVANPEHRAGSNVQNCAESNFFQPQHHHMWPQNQGSRGESPAEFGLLPSQCRGVLIFSCLAWCPVSQQASQKASLNHLVWRSVVSDQHMDLLSSHHSHCLWYAVEQAPFTHGHSQRAKGALIFLVGLTCSWYWMEGS